MTIVDGFDDNHVTSGPELPGLSIYSGLLTVTRCAKKTRAARSQLNSRERARA